MQSDWPMVVKVSGFCIPAHNHPSGNLIPSDNDRNITMRIKEASHYMDLTLLDHLIITSEGEYFSMTDNGVI
jgi:DNA repair protein RadC